KLEGNQSQGFLMHRAFMPDAVISFPGERKEHPFVSARILLHAFFQKAGDRALGAADRPVQQKHTAFGAITLGSGLERIDQMHERPIKAVNRIAMFGGEFREELVASEFLLVFKNILGAM